MARWFDVDEEKRQHAYFWDPTFSFGVFRDDYGDMEGHILPIHWHHCAEYELVLSGQVEMRIHDEVCVLTPGDCAFVNSNTLHGGTQLSTAENAVVYAISFTPDLFTENVQSSMYRKYIQPFYGNTVHGFSIDTATPLGREMQDTLRRLVALRADDFGYELDVISGMGQLWHQTLRYIEENALTSPVEKLNMKQNEGIKTLLTYVESEYAKEITVDMLCEHAHISRRDCFRYFKRYTGKTPIEYINDVRLTQAAHLLRTTELPIVTVSSSCGFASQSYFGKLFAQKNGVSPSEYRKEVQAV